LITTNSNLTIRNEEISQRNVVLIRNYADIPLNPDLIEYIIILRKDNNNFHYNSRTQEETEDYDEFVSETFKHYLIRCQFRSIESQISKFRQNYNLPDSSVILNLINPNPATLTHRIKGETDIITDFSGNHIKVRDELRLIEFIRNFNNNI
jgi:hypothetical protein